MQSDPRQNVMSFATTRKQKQRILDQAAKEGKKPSRFMADVIQEKLDETNETTDI